MFFADWYELLHGDDEYPDEENDEESEEGDNGGVVDDATDEHDKNPVDKLVVHKLLLCSIFIFLLLLHFDSKVSILIEVWGLTRYDDETELIDGMV